MLIRIGYDIEFDLPNACPLLALLSVRPERVGDLRRPDTLRVEPEVPLEEFIDWFGNRCVRMLVPAGGLRLWSETTIEDDGLPDPLRPDARQHPIEELPHDVLQFLFNSRYCEVDRLSDIAWELFGHTPPGWARAQAVCDWVHEKVRFGYLFARSTKTALDVYTERVGVCRDFQHLAITFCRCLNIPARYATGYLGDIGVPRSHAEMDFSAWFEAYLDGAWHTFDARHNVPRIGRTLIAVGRDAVDAAITTSFGPSKLRKFTVLCDEVQEASGPGL